MKIIILGGGAMGKVLAGAAEENDEFEVVGMIDPLKGEKLSDISDADAVIDFSNPANLDMIKEYCTEKNCAAVIATTGYTEEQQRDIELLGTEVPVVFSANYSMGVNIMKRIISEITPVLSGSFDIEIIEKHHNKKLDAPSGTAKMLLEAADPSNEFEHIFGREGNRKRGHEIGVHAVRAGTIAGEHTIIYAGEDEILEIKHTAGSKRIFAAGALKAALFTQKVSKGFYTMEEVLFG